MNSYYYNPETKSENYLTNRNAEFYRGDLETIHPYYRTEFLNGQASIISFLKKTVLARAKFLRYKKLYTLSAEKCYNNKANNYTYSEAEVCEETLFNTDPVLNSLIDFNKEIEVKIQDNYEKAALNFTKKPNFSKDEFEKLHRNYLTRLNIYDRYLYYFLAHSLFIR